MRTSSFGHNTIYRNAKNTLDTKWAQADQYTMQELDDIYFTKPDTEITREKAQGLIQMRPCEREQRYSTFENKSEFLRSLNELLTWAPKENLRKKYNSIIRKGQKQEFVDLSLLKKMDAHLEWALKKQNIRSDQKKEEIDENIARISAGNKRLETEAEAQAKLMGERILHQLNKKVAGRAESIDKVKLYLDQQNQFEEEEERRAQEAAAIQEETDDDISEPETPVFQRCTAFKQSSFQITPMQTPQMAVYQEKQLRYMKGDHIWNRKSELTSNRRSELTAATDSLNLNFVDEDMPFGIAKTVKKPNKKSFLIAAESMISPKSAFKTRDSVPDPIDEDLAIMDRTSVSNRMRQLDRSIEDHVKILSRPESRDREACFTTLKKGIKNQYGINRRSLLNPEEQRKFDLKLTVERQSSMLKNTLESHHLHNKFSDKMKKRLNDSPLRRMKQLQQEQYQQIQNDMLNPFKK